MKTKKYQYILSLFLIGAAILAAIQIRAIAQAGSKLIRVTVGTERSEYPLGEVIGLRFEIENTSAQEIDVVDPNVFMGNMKLFVSNDGKNYVEYAGPNWAMVDGRGQKRKLDAQGVLEAKATMLFNRRIATDHLTPMYADRIKKERLDTDFALLEAGHYWLKAAYTNGKDTFRSEPIEIDITQPVGTDAVVWEQIKSDGAFAYFLHTGEVKYMPGSEEARDFTEKLRSITSDYPNTNFSERLNEGLVKYQRNLENVERLVAERQATN